MMKNKIITIISLVLVIGLGGISILKKDIELSSFERRKLAQIPKFDENFTSNLDEYLLDQFVFRNKLINLNSFINRKILNKIDNNDVYVVGDNIFDKTYPSNEDNCLKFSEKVNYIIENYCEDSNVYYSIIPDKSYFLGRRKYLKLDYRKLYDIVTNNTEGNYIDIKNLLNIDDYYRTDIHWKQENLGKVTKQLVTTMGKTYKDISYIENKYSNFYGASYSKAGANIKPDTLKYLSNKELENVEVKHLEYGKKDVYDVNKLESLDAYDVFLSGASSFIEIENKNINDNSTLIIFRDSFASSLVPLLIPYYNKIVMVDLRYIHFDYAKNIINFENADVLFLYSTLIINNSSTLKVSVK